MTDKNYIIYEQEPVKFLRELIGIFVILGLMFLLIVLLPESFIENYTIVFLLILSVIVVVVVTLNGKYIFYQKLKIEMKEDHLEISFPRRKNKQHILIKMDEIVGTEFKVEGLSQWRHFIIMLKNGKQYSISKKSLYNLVRDDFKQFKKDIESFLSLRNLTAANSGS